MLTSFNKLLETQVNQNWRVFRRALKVMEQKMSTLMTLWTTLDKLESPSYRNHKGPHEDSPEGQRVKGATEQIFVIGLLSSLCVIFQWRTTLLLFKQLPSAFSLCQWAQGIVFWKCPCSMYNFLLLPRQEGVILGAKLNNVPNVSSHLLPLPMAG